MHISRFLRFAVLLICGVAASAWSATAEKSPLLTETQYVPDISIFMQIGANSPTGLSWDGHDLYFTSDASGARQVYRIRDDGWPYQLTAFEDGIDFFVLSHHGTMGIIGGSVGGSEQSQLFLIDTKSGRVVQLTNEPDVQRRSVVWSPDDKYIYYRSNEENKRDFFIYRMNISDKEKKKVFGEEGSGYNSVADLSPDGRYLLVERWVTSNSNDLFIVNLETGDSQKLNADTGYIYGGGKIMPDNKTIWLICDNNPEAILRLATMTVGQPGVDYVEGWVDPRWEVDGFNMSHDFRYMSIFYNEEGYTRLVIRDLENDTELPSPPLDGHFGYGEFDRDGDCILSFNSPTRAPDAWRWNPQTNEFQQLTHATYAGISRDLLSEPELIHYESFDGLEIPAFLYTPSGYDGDEPIPFVIYAHGGPASQFKPYFIRNFQYMILHGFGVLAVNPRGSSGYGREYMSLDDYKKRKHSLKDYKAGVDYLIEKGHTERGHIGIVGGSYGGYVVLGMITEYPDLFSAAIDAVGIANFKTFLERTKPYRRHLRESEYGPLSDPEFLLSISPITKAHKIKTPLLVIHGENDPRVPVYEARQIIEKVSEAGGIVDSLIFPDEGHGTSKTVNIIERYRRQVQFFEKYLKNTEN